jgi:beta-lactamase regulating signal transducer with metallopeptidase domain
MFAARGIAVSFSVFVVVYCVLSFAVCLCWRAVNLHTQRLSVRRIADFLFALRMFPLVTAAVITAAFTVPSFLLLEPRAIDEPMSDIPLTLGIFGAMLGAFGLVNAGLAIRKASCAISTWTSKARPVESCGSVPVLRISQAVPAITAAGIVRPKVLLSSVAEFLLTTNELQTALNHEIAHVRRRDNLKKLLLRFVAFPGMAGLEAAWLEATEMAADDAAVSNAGEALDLAAAIIKLSRLAPVDPPVDLTAALVHGPASIMSARVERLIDWSNERLSSPLRFSSWYGVGAALATVAVFAVPYSQLLVRVHTATEWLVR